MKIKFESIKQAVSDSVLDVVSDSHDERKRALTIIAN